MTTPTVDVIPHHVRYSSRFRTIQRNVILYWLASLVIIPVYTTCIYVLVNALFNFRERFIPDWTAACENRATGSFLTDMLNSQQLCNLLFPVASFAVVAAAVALGLAALFIGFNTMLIPAEWKQGFKQRESTTIVAVLMFSQWLHLDAGAQRVLLLTAVVLLMTGLFQLIRWLRGDYQRIVITGIGAVTLFWLLGYWIPGMRLDESWAALWGALQQEWLRLVSLRLWLLLSIVAVFYSFHRIWGWFWMRRLQLGRDHGQAQESVSKPRGLSTFWLELAGAVVGAAILLAGVLVDSRLLPSAVAQVALAVVATILIAALIFSLPRKHLTGYLRTEILWTSVKALLVSIVVGVVIGIIRSDNRYQASEWVALLALLTLGLLFIAARPANFLSRQRSHLRSLFTSIRSDRLYSQASPLYRHRHPLNRLFKDWIPAFFNWENRNLFFMLAIVLGGVVFPFVLYIWTSDPTITVAGIPIITSRGGWDSNLEPLSLMLIGLLTSGVLSLIYTVFWLARVRSRYIVTQFEASDVDSKRSPEMTAIAKLTTRILVDEMQRISTLLKLRQVEDVHLNREDSNAFFITSGIEQEFLDQIQQVVEVDLPVTGRLDLGRLLNGLLRSLARIRVQGRVQQRTNGSVEIWVSLNYRNQQSAAADMVLVPENSIQEIDEAFVRPIARELALKLMIDLGQMPHLGSNWRTLDHFLNGLQASAKRNWWQAIAFYREALQAEETAQGHFGLGHFHLGAALVYQGNWHEGLEHLQTAESDGPPIAEAQYMLAFTLLYIYWGELHRRPNIVKDIEWRCKQALKLRADFPEAHHLRGTLHYRLARSIDRESAREEAAGDVQASSDDRTRSNNRNRIPNFDMMAEYRQAARHFRLAVGHYDQRIGRVQRIGSVLGETDDPVADLLRQRMAAAHQLGDALRALGRYAEADSYYRDVATMMPRVVRNLADQAKNYCLAQNWQKAEEFIFRIAFKHDIALWDADVNIHVGWLLSAGMVDSNTNHLKRASELRFRELQRLSHNITEQTFDRRSAVWWLAEAMEYLDFAIHQRPRYLQDWRQTNWRDAFEQALTLAETLDGADRSPVDFTQKFVDKNHNENPLKLEYLRVWLGLRARRYGQGEIWKEYVSSFLKQLPRIRPTHRGRVNGFSSHDNSLIDLIREATEFERELSESDIQPAGGLRNLYRRKDMAQRAYTLWEAVSDDIAILPARENLQLSFFGRWAMDVYHETAVLTARLAADARAYELVYTVAKKSFEVSEAWVAAWKAEYQRGGPHHSSIGMNYFTFSPRVNRYERVTLAAWKAYATLQLLTHDLTKARIKAAGKKPLPDLPHEVILDQVQKDIAKAQATMRHHPLLMLAQALLHRENGLYAQAIEELERLLDVVAPFDPKHDVRDPLLGEIRATTNEERVQLYYYERVCGRQQFHRLVDPVYIHQLIADIYVHDLHKLDLCVSHLIEAIRWSPYTDVDVDLFLRLANRLNTMERYAEAQAVIEAVRVPSEKLEGLELSDTKRTAPDVLEVVVNTRRLRFHRALPDAKRLAYRYTIRTLAEYKRAMESTPKSNPEGFARAFSAVVDCLNANIRQAIAPDTGKVRSEFQRMAERILGIRVTDRPVKLSTLIYRMPPTYFKQRYYPDVHPQKSFPQVFTRLLAGDDSSKQRDTKGFIQLINRTGWLGGVAHNSEALTHLLRKCYAADPPYSMLDRVFFSEVVYFLADDAHHSLMHIAEICNALAYNRVETSVYDEAYAFLDSCTALSIMAYLYETTSQKSRRAQLAEKLAQYCDTFGWLHYRLISPTVEEVDRHGTFDTVRAREFLKVAEQFLLLGLYFDPMRPVIHYHLARVYLTSAEMLWQDNPAGVLGAKAGNEAHLIDNYITQAFREWRSANQYDQYGRLHQKLSWLYNRISLYKRYWEQRQLRGIAGDAKIEIGLPRSSPD